MSQTQEEPRKGLFQYIVLVGVGAFATTFAQLRIVGSLPTTFLLKDGMHLAKEDVALFFFWATFAWNLKPIAGILTDAFPLFGTRRRHYMIFGAVIAAAMWGLMALAAGNLTAVGDAGESPSGYGLLLGAAVVMNIAMVFSSTVMGGLMVEAGQAYGAPGRIASLRQVVQSVALVLGPMCGGYLAERAYGLTAGIAAGTVLALAAICAVVLKEKPVDRQAVVAVDPNHQRFKPSAGMLGGIGVLIAVATGLWLTPELHNIGISLYALASVFLMILGLSVVPTTNPVIVRAQTQLSQIFVSKTLWMAVGMLFLVYTVPGLNTALVYQQSDVLKFEPDYIGKLSSVEGVVGIIAAAAYGAVCRRFNLRFLIIAGVGTSALTTYLYLIYSQDTAIMVHAATGFCGVLAELALMDLAVRSTPKGCEALGFALMMSVRNFGLSMSDVIGSQIMDQYKISFETMVTVNGTTTLAVMLFVPLLPMLIVGKREGEAIG